jgi:threonine/homoserine/homoserine lactone efflux protein
MFSALDGRFAVWITVAVILIVTPGPDTALIIRQALRGGTRAASRSAFGVGVVLEGSAAAFTVLKLAGAVYLIYLGARSLIGSFGSPTDPASTSAQPKNAPLRASSAFAQGLANNLLNPKAGAIFVTVMPQFIQPHDSLIRLLLMVACYDVMVVVWLCAYGQVVSRAGCSRIGVRVRRSLEQVTGIVMIALGARLAFERR